MPGAGVLRCPWAAGHRLDLPRGHQPAPPCASPLATTPVRSCCWSILALLRAVYGLLSCACVVWRGRVLERSEVKVGCVLAETGDAPATSHKG